MSNGANCTDWAELLEAAATDTLETMCFFGVMGPMDEMPDGEEHLAARLTFRGDVNGAFHATLVLPAAWAIAANFLGEEPEDITLPRVEAVVCELANMICGSVLSNYKRDGHFELSSPEITAEEPSQPNQVIRRVLELETGSMAVALDLLPPV
jgi:CheY-specific phosphatase CheX